MYVFIIAWQHISYSNSHNSMRGYDIFVYWILWKDVHSCHRQNVCFPIISGRCGVSCGSTAYLGHKYGNHRSWQDGSKYPLNSFRQLEGIRYKSIENLQVKTCVSSRVNVAFIPDNLDHVLVDMYIILLAIIFVKNDMDLVCHSPGLFVAPATRGFCAPVKRLDELRICSIPVPQHSAGAWNVVHRLCLIKNAYNIIFWNQLVSLSVTHKYVSCAAMVISSHTEAACVSKGELNFWENMYPWLFAFGKIRSPLIGR